MKFLKIEGDELKISKHGVISEFYDKYVLEISRVEGVYQGTIYPPNTDYLIMDSNKKLELSIVQLYDDYKSAENAMERTIVFFKEKDLK
jgi:hypothetical protein